MPRLKLNLPPTARHWTKTPNVIFDHLLPTLKDTELRVLLVLLRETAGWNREGRIVVLSYARLEHKTGRQSEAVARALAGLSRRGLIHRSDEWRHRKAKNPLRKSEEQQYKDKR